MIEVKKYMFVYFYEQVHKTTGEVRHVNLGSSVCHLTRVKNNPKWTTLRLLQQRCKTQTPWIVRCIGAMPIDMYEGHPFANYDGPVYLENYV